MRRHLGSGDSVLPSDPSEAGKSGVERLPPAHDAATAERERPLAIEPDTRTASWGRGEERERAAPLEADTWIGRYRIVGLLGSGGLGSVYRAHDPALARDIALKILHRRFEPGARETAAHRRLLQEGQALAKLSHPNVVTVYDVGIQDDVVFIAMELVHGQSLAGWLGAGPSRDEVLRVLIAAGRGLAAAHAAGLTHGDFKPANVMLSREGQVRIVDFGLAQTIGDGAVVAPARGGVETTEASASSPDRAASAPAGDGLESATSRASTAALAAPSTSHTTALRGTPGYIAPELFDGQAAADAPADQFSFAVTAFVALTGRKPPVPHGPPVPHAARAAPLLAPHAHSAETPEERHGLAPAVARPVWPPSVPSRVCRVVERGMAIAPAERYPSLGALLDALERATKPRRSSAAWLALSLAAVSLAGVLLAGAAVFQRGRWGGARCELDAAPFAGVWDAERRAEVERALLATGRPNAAEAFALLAGRLDEFEASWLEMQQAACESSLVRGAQPERVFALQSTCLKHKLEGLAALVGAFTSADARAVDRAAGVVPDTLQECADVAMLTGVADALPDDSAQREAIDAIWSGAAVVAAELSAGRDARARARELHEAALALGHTPTIATTLSWVGRSLVASGRGDGALLEAKRVLHETMRLAAQVGDRSLLAMTASYLLNIVAFREKRTDEGDAMLPVVDALVSQGGNEPELRLEVLISQGAILTQRGKYLDAIAVFEQAAALSREVRSQRKAYGALALGQIGDNYLELGRYAEALRSRHAEVDGIVAIYGARHPRVLSSSFNLGIVQIKAGDLDGARATAARLRDLDAALLEAGDWRHAMLLFLEGNIAERAGDCLAAMPLYRTTLEKLVAFYGPEHNNTSDVYERLGSCLHATGQSAEAAEHLERALAIRRALGSPPRTAEVAFQLAGVVWARGKSERRRAIELAEEAVSLWRRGTVSEAGIAAERWLVEHRLVATP